MQWIIHRTKKLACWISFLINAYANNFLSNFALSIIIDATHSGLGYVSYEKSCSGNFSKLHKKFHAKQPFLN